MKARIDRLKAHPLVEALLTHYKSAEVDLSSIAVAYYLLLTLFPFLILVANSLPYLQIDATALLVFLQEHLPGEFYELVSDPLVAVLNQPAVGLVWVSALTALWTMSRGFFFLQKAVNKAYDNSEDQRDLILGRVIGVLSGIVLIVFLVLGIFVSSFGQTLLALLGRSLDLPAEVQTWLSLLIQPLVFLVFLLALAILYYLLPNVRLTKKRYVLPGTVFTSLVLVSTASLFGTYVNRTLAQMPNLRVLGSVAIFALMLWFILFAKVMIMGAVLNASYQVYCEGQLVARRGKVSALLNDRLTEAAEEVDDET